MYTKTCNTTLCVPREEEECTETAEHKGGSVHACSKETLHIKHLSLVFKDGPAVPARLDERKHSKPQEEREKQAEAACAHQRLLLGV